MEIFKHLGALRGFKFLIAAFLVAPVAIPKVLEDVPPWQFLTFYAVIYSLLLIATVKLVRIHPGVLAEAEGAAAPAEGTQPAAEAAGTGGIFVSAPMAAFQHDEARYHAQHDDVRAICEALESKLHADCYYGGQGMPKTEDFQNERVAFREVFDRIRGAAYFVLIYPERLASSVLVEAGMALALGKKCAFFVRDPQDLPYLLRNVGQSGVPGVAAVVYTCASTPEILHLIDRSGPEIF
jgi:hypothetical protein